VAIERHDREWRTDEGEEMRVLPAVHDPEPNSLTHVGLKPHPVAAAIDVQPLRAGRSWGLTPGWEETGDDLFVEKDSVIPVVALGGVPGLDDERAK
jgi:hypothetical protein